MDIVCHAVVNAFFLSHRLRDDVELHLVFYGPPTPPRHLLLEVRPETGLSKKDVAGLIKRMLYKYREGRTEEVFPGCFVEKASLLDVTRRLEGEGRRIYVLDRRGVPISSLPDEDLRRAVFVLGDHEGLPRKETAGLMRTAEKVSLGCRTYFSSQVITILNYEMDRRGL